MCSTILPFLWASGPLWLLEMTGWQLAGRIGVGDCSVGSVLPCDSLLVSLHKEQHWTCIGSTLGTEEKKKISTNPLATPSPPPLPPPPPHTHTSPSLCSPSRQSSFFLGWLRRWGLVTVWVYVCEQKRGGKKQAVELYIFLMEGDTVGALRINLDAWMES